MGWVVGWCYRVRGSGGKGNPESVVGGWAWGGVDGMRGVMGERGHVEGGGRGRD